MRWYQRIEIAEHLNVERNGKMIEILDRVPSVGKQNMKKIIYPDGREEIVTIVAADDAVVVGTPVNRSTLMALQGFVAKTTRFNEDGSIVETNEVGHTKTTTFNSDGSITETFVGETTIIKKTTFNEDGSISEVIL